MWALLERIDMSMHIHPYPHTFTRMHIKCTYMCMQVYRYAHPSISIYFYMYSYKCTYMCMQVCGLTFIKHAYTGTLHTWMALHRFGYIHRNAYHCTRMQAWKPHPYTHAHVSLECLWMYMHADAYKMHACMHEYKHPYLFIYQKDPHIVIYHSYAVREGEGERKREKEREFHIPRITLKPRR